MKRIEFKVYANTENLLGNNFQTVLLSRIPQTGDLIQIQRLREQSLADLQKTGNVFEVEKVIEVDGNDSFYEDLRTIKITVR